MVNAVVHGNRYNSNKKVRFSVASSTGSRFTVRIADEGEGFDFENLPDPLAPENLHAHLRPGDFSDPVLYGRVSDPASGSGRHGSNFGQVRGV